VRHKTFLFCCLVCMLPMPFPKVAAEEVGIYASGDALTRNCRGFLAVVRNNNRGTGEEGNRYHACYAFVTGILDANSVERTRWFCPPPLNANILVEVVASYVDRTPEERELPAFALVKKALERTYPCK
jgi:hypothetical protein